MYLVEKKLPRFRSGYVWATAVALLLLSAQAAAFWGKSEWRLYKSDNFTVYSDEKPKKVKELVGDLERFRVAALQFTAMADQPENAHMRVLIFAQDEEYRKFMERRETLGIYLDTHAGPIVLVAPKERWLDNTVVLFHEYVHAMFRQRSAISYPKWYSEGFAELLSSALIQPKSVSIGKVPLGRSYHLSTRRIMSVKDLLAPQYGSMKKDYWLRFYAAAWLFTHYLQLGPLQGEPDHTKDVRKYILMLSEGADPVASFEPVFGVSIEEMDARLRKYKKRKLTGLSFEVAPYAGDFTQQDLSKNERIFMLADAARLFHKDDLALEYLAEIEGDDLEAARARSLKAVLLHLKKEHEQADRLMANALAGGEEDYHLLLNASHYYLDKLMTTDNAELRETYYNQVTSLGEKAAQNADGRFEIYRYLWMAHQAQNQRIAALKSMLAAYQADPSNVLLNFTLGSFLSGGEKPELAIPFLESVLAWTHHGDLRTEAQELLEKVTKASNVAENNRDKSSRAGGGASKRPRPKSSSDTSRSSNR